MSRLVHPRQSPVRSRRFTASAGLDDEDAEGEEDEVGEDGGDAEDQELYCYCQKLSYGEVRPSASCVAHARAVAAGCAVPGCEVVVEGGDADHRLRGVVQMIACDNEECKYQWVRQGLPFCRWALWLRAGFARCLTATVCLRLWLTRFLRDAVPPLVRGPQAATARHMVLQRLQAEAGDAGHVYATDGRRLGVDWGRPERAKETVESIYVKWDAMSETQRTGAPRDMWKALFALWLGSEKRPWTQPGGTGSGAKVIARRHRGEAS